MTEVEKRILENQELMLLSLAQMLISENGSGCYSKYINADVDAYHLTRRMLENDDIDRGRRNIDAMRYRKR